MLFWLEKKKCCQHPVLILHFAVTEDARWNLTSSVLVLLMSHPNKFSLLQCPTRHHLTFCDALASIFLFFYGGHGKEILETPISPEHNSLSYQPHCKHKQSLQSLCSKPACPATITSKTAKDQTPMSWRQGNQHCSSLHTAEGMVPSLGTSCELSTPWGWAHPQVCLTLIVRTGAPQETMRVCQGCAKHNSSGNICLRYVVVRRYNLPRVASSPSLYAGIDGHHMSEVLVKAR